MIRPALAAAAYLASSSALAYIPTLGSLLKRAASHPDDVDRSRDVTLKGTLQVGLSAPVPASLRLHFPLRCRLQTDQAGGKGQSPGAVTVEGAPEAPRVAEEGAGVGAGRDLLTLACPLLTFKTGPRGDRTESENILRSAAAAAGAQLEPSTLGRLIDRVVYVLGAPPPRNLEVPQLWLYKEEMAPARLIAKGDGGLRDLRLLEYGSPAAALAFPRVIELWSGDKLLARFESLEAGGRRTTAGAEEEE